MLLDILYWLFSLVWVILLPASLFQRVFLKDVENPAGRLGLSLCAALILLPIACFALASLLSVPVNEVVIFSVAGAWNVFGVIHRGAAYRRRMKSGE